MGTDLMLHCGAHKAEQGAVLGSKTPRGMTDTHFPIPHKNLLELALKAITDQGMVIRNAAHALSHDDARWFGLFEVALERQEQTRLALPGDGASHTDGLDIKPDYAMVIGVRNSHDMTFPAGLVIGSHVFVCDNLAFSGEVNMKRKHTRFILRDLPGLVEGAMGQLLSMRHLQEHRISTYKETALEDRDAHSLVIRAMQANVIPNARVRDVVAQWEEPAHEDFEPRTAWSLFNGFTEVLKNRGALGDRPRHTQALHGLMDGACGLNKSAVAAGALEGSEDAEITVGGQAVA